MQYNLKQVNSSTCILVNGIWMTSEVSKTDALKTSPKPFDTSPYYCHEASITTEPGARTAQVRIGGYLLTCHAPHGMWPTLQATIRGQKKLNRCNNWLLSNTLLKGCVCSIKTQYCFLEFTCLNPSTTSSYMNLWMQSFCA